jgi:preprotein translocase subunit SecG
MKVKTVVLERMGGKRKVLERSIFIAVVAHVVNIIFGAVLPFVLGFYFARTQNLLFFLFFIAAIFFEVRIDYKGDTVKLNIMRLF